jgi:hypothetical protein
LHPLAAAACCWQTSKNGLDHLFSPCVFVQPESLRIYIRGNKSDENMHRQDLNLTLSLAARAGKKLPIT